MKDKKQQLKKRRVIIVLGPHRSGTSLTAKALESLGVNLGGNLILPNEDNKKGFFENPNIVSFNDTLLNELGASWDCAYVDERKVELISQNKRLLGQAQAIVRKEFEEYELIGLKDPRFCLLMPFWQQVFELMGLTSDYILVFRDPIESALSQQKRALTNPKFHFVGKELDEGVLLWAGYMACALTYLAKDKPIILHVSSILSSPVATLERLASRLGLSLNSDAAESYQTSFIDKKLLREHAVGDELDIYPHLCAIIKSYGLLDKLINEEKSPRSNGLNAIATNLQETVFKAFSEKEMHQRLFARVRNVAVGCYLEGLEAEKIIAYQTDRIERNDAEIKEAQQVIAYQDEHVKRANVEAKEAQQIIAYQADRINRSVEEAKEAQQIIAYQADRINRSVEEGKEAQQIIAYQADRINRSAEEGKEAQQIIAYQTDRIFQDEKELGLLRDKISHQIFSRTALCNKLTFNHCQELKQFFKSLWKKNSE